MAAARRLLSVAAPAAWCVSMSAFSEKKQAHCDSDTMTQKRLLKLEQRCDALEAGAVLNAGATSNSRTSQASWAAPVLKPELLYTTREIDTMVESLAQQITRDYAHTEDLIVIGLLDGVFMFLADLSRKIDVPHTLDFISASSYGLGTVASGVPPGSQKDERD